MARRQGALLRGGGDQQRTQNGGRGKGWGGGSHSVGHRQAQGVHQALIEKVYEWVPLKLHKALGLSAF